jgi:hypothetical protein
MDAVRDRDPRDQQGVAVDGDLIAVAHVPEGVLADRVQQRDARLDQQLRPEIRIPPRDGGLRVDYGPHARRHQRLGGNPVQVDMVDEGDVAGPQPADESLGPAVRPRGADDPGRVADPEPSQGRKKAHRTPSWHHRRTMSCTTCSFCYFRSALR